MKNRSIVSLIVLILVSWGCAHTPESTKEAAKPDAAPASALTGGAPALEAPESSFDFGEMKDGTDYVHAFVIRNKGTGVLEIKQIQPG